MPQSLNLTQCSCRDLCLEQNPVRVLTLELFWYNLRSRHSPCLIHPWPLSDFPHECIDNLPHCRCHQCKIFPKFSGLFHLKFQTFQLSRGFLPPISLAIRQRCTPQRYGFPTLGKFNTCLTTEKYVLNYMFLKNYVLNYVL